MSELGRILTHLRECVAAVELEVGTNQYSFAKLIDENMKLTDENDLLRAENDRMRLALEKIRDLFPADCTSREHYEALIYEFATSALRGDGPRSHSEEFLKLIASRPRGKSDE